MMSMTRARGCRTFAALAAVLVFSLSSVAAHYAEAPQSRATSVVDTRVALGQSTANASRDRELIDQYCVRCHNERTQSGGLALDQVDVDRVADNRELWEKVAWKVRIGAMPKVPARRPDGATLARFVTSLETALDRAADTAPMTGRPTLHRLNRLQYVNTVRDLLGLEIDGDALLPADVASYGFDNNEDALSLTPAIFDRYMIAATKVSRVAMGDPTIPPGLEIYSIRQSVGQSQRMSEDLPFGTRGGIVVRHTFPVDGEYEIQVGLKPGAASSPGEAIATVDRNRVGSWPLGSRRRNGDMPAEDGPLSVRVAMKAGTRTLGATLLRTGSGYGEGLRASQMGGGGGIDYVAVAGPYTGSVPEASESRRRILVCRPTDPTEEEGCARDILSTLARRAFSRPVNDSDVEPLMGFYDMGRSDGDFDAGIQAALERLLISPQFLFRVERAPVDAAPGTVFEVSDVELASRLSFFLWSTIPDAELLDIAERGELTDPAVLARQVRRMLADDRAAALASNFAGQWLRTRDTRNKTPDPRLFRSYNENLKEAMARETEMFLESQMSEDRSVLDLLSADDTYVNQQLAEHYGIPGIYGSHMRRVTLTDERRFGLLGKGSVLMVTSHAHRTSPVLRGKWVMENLLGAPPPPPPPNVPPFPENDGEVASTVRERLVQHRRNPVCASCHSAMDPFGFALENFDVTGKWRDTDADAPVDASATLLDGTKVVGPIELRNALLAKGDLFATVFTEKLLTYALGRAVEYYDRPALRRIVQQSATEDHRWSAIIMGIVQSLPFRTNRTSLGDAQPNTIIAAR